MSKKLSSHALSTSTSGLPLDSFSNYATLSQQERNLILEREKSTVNQLAQDMILLATNGGGGGGGHGGGGGPVISKSNSASRQPENQSVFTKSILSNLVYGNGGDSNTNIRGSNINIGGAKSLSSPSAGGNGSATLQLSEIETAILRSTVPLDLSETEEITVNGERGILLNRNEIANWRGIPLSQYAINDDPNPEIIRKQTDQKLVYHQEVAIRYLRPPTPPPPGEILIQQDSNTFIPPAPPLVIRQQPPRPTTPPPLVVREAPPPPPPAVGRKVITISGKSIPPPPRKVIIERLPPLPTKPQSVIIERWLPYKQIKRKVIYTKANSSDAVLVKPKNVIIQWEPPKVQVKKEFKDLGIVRANPTEYVERYGSSLKRAIELPTFVKDIKPPAGLQLAAESGQDALFELEGDVYALNLVDLEREGLIEYKYLLKQVDSSRGSATPNARLSEQIIGSQYANGNDDAEITRSINSSHTNLNLLGKNIIVNDNNNNNSNNSLNDSNLKTKSSLDSFVNAQQSDEKMNDLFNLIDIDANNTISYLEAEKLFERLNSKLGKKQVR